MVCLFVCICSYNTLFASDSTTTSRCKIVLTNGVELIGEIVDESSTEIVLKSEGVESKVQRTFIKRIEYLSPEELEREMEVYRNNGGKRLNNLIAGLTLGTPSVGNIRVGFRFDDWGIHLSGGYWGSSHGIQISPMLLFARNEKTYHYISGMVGYAHFRDGWAMPEHSQNRKELEWLYGGIGYVFNTRGFFVELGLTSGTGSYTSPQPIFQIGYVN